MVPMSPSKLFGYVVGQDFNDFQDFNVDFYIKKVINLPQE